jgi:chromate transport protein ChrA
LTIVLNVSIGNPLKFFPGCNLNKNSIYLRGSSGKSMDALTAGIALILVQFCIALVMAGVFYTTPSEKCTKYWALSGVWIAFGILIAIVNNRLHRPAFILNGAGAVMIGLPATLHPDLGYRPDSA